MNTYKILIKPESPFATEFHSDTIFGHICWAKRYLYGEKNLTDFLNDLKNDKLHLIISNAFPKDLLPLPILKPLNFDEKRNLAKFLYNKENISDIEFNKFLMEDFKKINKVKFIPVSVFEKISNSLSNYNLFLNILELYKQNPDKIEELTDNIIFAEVKRNKINRLSYTVEEGNLFSSHYFWYSKDLYIIILTELNKSEIEKIFEYISFFGFGADRSVGKGNFKFKIETPFNLPEVKNNNAHLILSNYFPAPDEKFDGFYNTITKFGKLGDIYSCSKFFLKKPLIFIAPGSVIKFNKNKKFYGSLIENIHSDNSIHHYGFTLTIGVKLC